MRLPQTQDIKINFDFFVSVQLQWLPVLLHMYQLMGKWNSHELQTPSNFLEVITRRKVFNYSATKNGHKREQNFP